MIKNFLHTFGLCSLLILAGCGIFKEEKPKPLPGERFTVLQEEKTLHPDETVAQRSLDLMADVENSEWPQDSYLPSHAGANLALAKVPKEIWRASIGEGANDRQYLLAQPVVSNNVIYTMDSVGRVAAFKLENGKQIWRVSVLPKKDSGEAPVGGIAFDQNRLFATNGRRDVMALDAKNGGRIWNFELPAPARAAPTIADGRVYVVTLDNQLIVLKQDNGQELWRHSGISEAASVLGGSAPAVDGDLVVATYSSGEIFALRPENGLPVWSDSLSGRKGGSMSELSDIRGNPVIDQDLVVASSFGKRLAAFDRRSGDRSWQQAIGSSQTPLVVGNWIFIISQDAELTALDREKGEVRFLTQLDRWEDVEDKKGTLSWAGPVLAGGQIWCYGSNGKLVAIDPDKGTMVQTIKTEEGAGLSPIVAQKTLLTISKDGDLIAYK